MRQTLPSLTGPAMDQWLDRLGHLVPQDRCVRTSLVARHMRGCLEASRPREGRPAAGPATRWGSDLRRTQPPGRTVCCLGAPDRYRGTGPPGSETVPLSRWQASLEVVDATRQMAEGPAIPPLNPGPHRCVRTVRAGLSVGSVADGHRTGARPAASDLSLAGGGHIATIGPDQRAVRDDRSPLTASGPTEPWGDGARDEPVPRRADRPCVVGKSVRIGELSMCGSRRCRR